MGFIPSIAGVLVSASEWSPCLLYTSVGHLPEAEARVAARVCAVDELLAHEDVVVGLVGLGDELRLLALLVRCV